MLYQNSSLLLKFAISYCISIVFLSTSIYCCIVFLFYFYNFFQKQTLISFPLYSSFIVKHLTPSVKGQQRTISWQVKQTLGDNLFYTFKHFAFPGACGYHNNPSDFTLNLDQEKEILRVINDMNGIISTVNLKTKLCGQLCNPANFRRRKQLKWVQISIRKGVFF